MPFSYGTKVGDRFGSRVVMGFARQRDSDGHIRCHWKCDCGNKGTGGLKSLRHTLKCAQCVVRYDKGRPTHGQAGGTSKDKNVGRTKLYQSWVNMTQRTNPNSSGPRNRQWYSGKGITVCEAWKTFEGFRDWAMTNGYQDGLTIDRIHPWANYEPGNCEWVTRSENSRRAVQDIWRQQETFPIEMLWGAI